MIAVRFIGGASGNGARVCLCGVKEGVTRGSQQRVSLRGRAELASPVHGHWLVYMLLL